MARASGSLPDVVSPAQLAVFGVLDPKSPSLAENVSHAIRRGRRNVDYSEHSPEHPARVHEHHDRDRTGDRTGKDQNVRLRGLLQRDLRARPDPVHETDAAVLLLLAAAGRHSDTQGDVRRDHRRLHPGVLRGPDGEDAVRVASAGGGVLGVLGDDREGGCRVQRGEDRGCVDEYTQGRSGEDEGESD